ncbi:MAG: hypothetical protein V7K83_18555 [Nostoc sp.]
MALGIKKSLSPNNKAFKTLTSTLSVVVTESKWLLKPQERLQQELKSTQIYPFNHTTNLHCNPLLNGRYNFSDFADIKSPRTSIALLIS